MTYLIFKTSSNRLVVDIPVYAFFKIIKCFNCLFYKSIETQDTGKPYLDVIGDIEHSVEVYKYYGGLADKIGGKTIPLGELNTLN